MSCYLHWGMINTVISERLVVMTYFLLFQLLFANIIYMIICSIVYMFVNEEDFQALPNIPSVRTAIVYVVKNEKYQYLQNILYSYRCNQDVHADYWIISSSKEQFYIDLEADFVKLFEQETKCVLNLFRSSKSKDGKKHTSLNDWAHNFSDYEYVMICDADSRVPQGVMANLLRIAHHPSNSHIGVFQSHLIVRDCHSIFSTLLKNAQNIGQRLYAGAMYRIFGRSASWGSGALMRTKILCKLNVPDRVLSHDIWDTVQIELIGSRVVYVNHIETYESYPENYLESLSREKRWMKGNIGAFPLAFKPGLSFASRFFVLYPIYCYFVQPILLLCIFAGLFLEVTDKSLMFATQKFALVGSAVLHLEHGGVFLFIILVLVGHRIPAVHSTKELFLLLLEILFSTLIMLNNVLYMSLSLLRLPFESIEWDPKFRKVDRANSLKTYIRGLWPGSALALFFVIVGLIEAPIWTLATLPFIISFLFSIPLCWLSSLPTNVNQLTASNNQLQWMLNLVHKYSKRALKNSNRKSKFGAVSSHR